MTNQQLIELHNQVAQTNVELQFFFKSVYLSQVPKIDQMLNRVALQVYYQVL